MRLLVDEEIDYGEWEKLISESLLSTPFQTKEFFKFYHSVEGFSAKAFAVEENDIIKSSAVVVVQKEPGIKSFFSKRGIIYGGPIFKDLRAAEFLIKKITDYYSKKLIYLETRNFSDYSSLRNGFNDAGWNYEPYLNYQLSLQEISKKELLGLFKGNRRREIKKSIKEGAIYRSVNDENEIKEIYEILDDLYKNRVKLPLPPLNYFLGLYRNKIVEVFIVIHDGRTIGGAICAIYPERSIYTWYYCGLREYHNKIYSTHLAILASMEYAIENNISTFDFMGAGKPDVDYGVRKYKSQFGGEEVEHGRFMKILNKPLYEIGKLGLKVLSKF